MAQPAPIAQAALSAKPEARLRAVVVAHYDFLWRSLLRLAVKDGAVEDAAQQVLLILAKRLDDVDAGAERAFLFGTALRVAADARKRYARLCEVGAAPLDG